MSKPVKELIRKELIGRFAGVTQLAVVGFTGLNARKTNEIRARLRERDIRMTVVRNALAKQAFGATGIANAGELLDGPCAVAYGADSVVTVVRELLAIHRDEPSLTVKAAFLEGELFGADRIDALSKFPTREEAIGQVVACALSSGANLAGCLVGPGAQLAGILKAIEDRHGGEQADAA
jgi:large subunit ribosomal protein L10